MQKNLSNDFSKKMEAWQKIKAKEGSSGSKAQTPTGDRKQELIIPKVSALELGSTKIGSFQRKDKSPKGRVDHCDKSPSKQKDREKALQWVDKELQKIEKEKQRLAKERQKYQERKERLEKLKGSIVKPLKKQNQDILIKTSAGEFRFEGISKTFTKKLYEWEEKRGVDPELSTIALLSSNVHPSLKDEAARKSPTSIAKSRSETSLRSSSHSSSVYSLGTDKIEGFSSLSTSEPQLPAATSYSPEEVTRPIDCDSMDLSGATPPDVANVPPRSFYLPRDADDDRCGCLWDENMSLLERLKLKENECKQLESKLSQLDNRLERMTSQHGQEVGMLRHSRLFLPSHTSATDT